MFVIRISLSRQPSKHHKHLRSPCWLRPRAPRRCHRAAMEAASAAGPLGVSNEEAARRGAEVDRILKQREGSDTHHSLKPSPSPAPSTPTMVGTGDAMGASSSRGKVDGDLTGGVDMVVPKLGSLEDRQVSTQDVHIRRRDSQLFLRLLNGLVGKLSLRVFS